MATAATRTPAQAAAAARAHAKYKTLDKVAGTRQVVLAYGTPRLAYESVVSSRSGAQPSKLHVFTDANTGALVHSYDEVHEGTGTGKWNGPNPLAIDTSHPTSTTWTMTDPIRSNVSCRNYTGGAVLSGTDDVWGNGVGTSIETGCVDSLYGVQTQWKHAQPAGSAVTASTAPAAASRSTWASTTSTPTGTAPRSRSARTSAGEWISAMDVVGHEYGHGHRRQHPRRHRLLRGRRVHR